MTGRLVSINVSRGGVPKKPIEEAEIGELGVAGDAQRDRRFHGGPDRAISLFSLEVLQALEREGHPVFPGALGENFTVQGLDWGRVTPGAKLQVGEAVLQVTSFAAPCKTIRRYFQAEKFTRVSQKVNPGQSRVYARVLQPGRVRSGDPVALVSGGIVDR